MRMRTFMATLALLSCLPTAAAALVIEFEGIVSLGADAHFDSSVFNGLSVTGRYEVDPTPSGGPPGEVGAARLTFAFGNYLIDVSQDLHVITLINDLSVGLATIDIWESGKFVVTPAITPDPDGIGFVAGVQLFDFSASMLTGSTPANFVPDFSTSANARVYLSELIASDAGVEENVHLAIVLPEPSSSALLGFGLLALAGPRAAERHKKSAGSGSRVQRQ